VDPITGEGIHYAFKSAAILAETFDQPGQYRRRVDAEIVVELARASRMYRRFYQGRFLGADFKKRTVQLARRSRTLQTILGNVISGNQSYVTLNKKLLVSLPSVTRLDAETFVAFSAPWRWRRRSVLFALHFGLDQRRLVTYRPRRGE
jgi:flavin-dependent dehydrogenase